MSFVENISKELFNIVSSKLMCSYFKDDTLNIASSIPVSIMYNPIYDYTSNSFRVLVGKDHPFYDFLEKLCVGGLYDTYFRSHSNVSSGEIILDIDYNDDLRDKFLKGYIEENKNLIKMNIKLRMGYDEDYNFRFLKINLNKFDFVE